MDPGAKRAMMVGILSGRTAMKVGSLCRGGQAHEADERHGDHLALCASCGHPLQPFPHAATLKGILRHLADLRYEHQKLPNYFGRCWKSVGNRPLMCNEVSGGDKAQIEAVAAPTQKPEQGGSKHEV